MTFCDLFRAALQIEAQETRSWTFVIDRLAHVEAGDVEPPETAEALIALLPDIDWP